MASAPAQTGGGRGASAAPDLAHFRKNYPLTVRGFGALPDREAWLRRVWEEDERWRERAAGRDPAREAVVRGAPPAGLSCEGEFEVIYSGGGLGLLHAALLSVCHGRRVAVFAGGDGAARGGRGWNVSGEDLREFERAGLLTKEEIESVVVNRDRSGYVKFHDAASRVKAPPLWVPGVLDVALDSGRLVALAAAKIRERGAAGSAVFEGERFVRAYVERRRVSVEVEGARGARRLFAARLFVDACGADSEVARQLNEGRAATHVCPTAGTVARGFARGDGAGSVNFRVGELLVSTEDASAHRQLIWEGFGGSAARDEYSTSLFFYDAADSPADKSLLALFERYFEKLPRYKRPGAQWRVVRPVFGHAPSFRPVGWKSRRATASERVLLACDGAARANPLAVSDFGARLRDLPRSARLVEHALRSDALDARSLSEIGTPVGRVAEAAGLAEFLRPAPRSSEAATVNETLNAVMAALHDLDERVRRDLFQDRMTFAGLKSLLARTVQLYPRLLQRVREQFGARGTLWWLARVTDAAFNERRDAARGEKGEGAGD